MKLKNVALFSVVRMSNEMKVLFVEMNIRAGRMKVVVITALSPAIH